MSCSVCGVCGVYMEREMSRISEVNGYEEKSMGSVDEKEGGLKMEGRVRILPGREFCYK